MGNFFLTLGLSFYWENIILVQSGGTGEGKGSVDLLEVLKTVENIKVTCALVICCFNNFACLIKCYSVNRHDGRC